VTRAKTDTSRSRSSLVSRLAEWTNQVSLQLLNIVQSAVIGIGLTVGSLYCAWLVSVKRELTVGDYILFGTYILQLYSPLNFFGTYYRLIQQAFIDMENMLDLLDIQPEIQDSPFAKDLLITDGTIEFDHVSFHYQVERPILKNISFRIAPGQTLAIVGPSGAGKRVERRDNVSVRTSDRSSSFQARAPSFGYSFVSTTSPAVRSESTAPTSPSSRKTRSVVRSASSRRTRSSSTKTFSTTFAMAV
jgi:ABC-type protease/lipase transport system fused ATPase/permease subunit